MSVSSPILTYADLIPPPELTASFNPAKRFGTTHFSDYDPQHSSQETALQQVQTFTKEAELRKMEAGRWFWQASQPRAGRGLYLDGGFGIGKTHLLASAYHAFPGSDEEKAYLSFQELVYFIGAQGRTEAERAFDPYRLICIDEFELDDSGNTLIVKNFLKYVFALGHHVITTSNTPPAAQGQGRFNAEHFQREIQSIADSFTILTIEGKDYRKREKDAVLLSSAALQQSLAEEITPSPKALLSWQELFALLVDYHPSRFEAIVSQIGTLYVDGVTTIASQNDALRFVHFIDTLYNDHIGLRMAGEIALSELFAPLYRDGAYAKKHYRCISRLSEILEEKFM